MGDFITLGGAQISASRHSMSIERYDAGIALLGSRFGSFNKQKFAIEAVIYLPDAPTTSGRLFALESDNWSAWIGGTALNLNLDFDTDNVDAFVVTEDDVFTAGAWTSVVINFDSTQATATDRLNVQKNGVDSNITKSGADTACAQNANIVFGTPGDERMIIGNNTNYNQGLQGLINRMSFFDGVNINASDVWNSATSKKKDISAISGLVWTFSADSDDGEGFLKDSDNGILFACNNITELAP